MQVEALLIPPAPPRVRVFTEDDLHVTLGFLGPVEAPEALAAWQTIDRFQSLSRVDGTFRCVRPLGHRRKPSALSALIQEGAPALSSMISEARAPLLEAAGAPPDDRSPLPHMTIARIQRRASAAERRHALEWAEALDLSRARFTASEVALYTWSSDRQSQLFRIVERRALAS
jgi:2'-5' RNA ligase